MSILNYGDLKNRVANYLNRSDLTSLIPDFVTLCENRIAYGSAENGMESKPLRVRQMETPTTILTTAQTVALPTGFLRAKRMYNQDGLSHNDVEMTTPDYLWGHYSNTAFTGRPAYYAVEGENFVFGPAPDSTYTLSLLYYQNPTAFAFDVDTNSLLTANAGIYLAGTLAEAFSYIRNEEQAQKWLAKFVGACNAMQVADGQDRYSGQWVARGDTGNP